MKLYNLSNINNNIKNIVSTFLPIYEEIRLKFLLNLSAVDTKFNENVAKVLTFLCKTKPHLEVNDYDVVGINLSKELSLARQTFAEVKQNDLVSAISTYIKMSIELTTSEWLILDLNEFAESDIDLLILILRTLDKNIKISFILPENIKDWSLWKEVIISAKTVKVESKVLYEFLDFLIDNNLPVHIAYIHTNRFDQRLITYSSRFPNHMQNIKIDLEGVSEEQVVSLIENNSQSLKDITFKEWYHRGRFQQTIIDLVSKTKTTDDKGLSLGLSQRYTYTTEVQDKKEYFLFNKDFVKELTGLAILHVTNNSLKDSMSVMKAATSLRTLALFFYNEDLDFVERFFDKLDLPVLSSISIAFEDENDKRFQFAKDHKLFTTLQKFQKLTNFEFHTSKIYDIIIKFTILQHYSTESEKMINYQFITFLLNNSKENEFYVIDPKAAIISELSHYLTKKKEVTVLSKLKNLECDKPDTPKPKDPAFAIKSLKYLKLREPSFDPFVSVETVHCLHVEKVHNKSPKLYQFLAEKGVRHVVINKVKDPEIMSYVLENLLTVTSLVRIVISEPMFYSSDFSEKIVSAILERKDFMGLIAKVVKIRTCDNIEEISKIRGLKIV